MKILVDLPNHGARGKVLVLSVKQRVLLHGLLHRDLRKCSISALSACSLAGWSAGAGGGHQLTAHGRSLAEISEDAPHHRELLLDLS